jgi:hypothetical protein
MLMQTAQQAADARWQLYEQMAGVHRVVTEDGHAPAAGAAPPSAASTPATAGDDKPAATTPQESAS